MSNHINLRERLIRSNHIYGSKKITAICKIHRCTTHDRDSCESLKLCDNFNSPRIFVDESNPDCRESIVNIDSLELV